MGRLNHGTMSSELLTFFRGFPTELWLRRNTWSWTAKDIRISQGLMIANSDFRSIKKTAQLEQMNLFSLHSTVWHQLGWSTFVFLYVVHPKWFGWQICSRDWNILKPPTAPVFGKWRCCLILQCQISSTAIGTAGAESTSYFVEAQWEALGVDVGWFHHSPLLQGVVDECFRLDKMGRLNGSFHLTSLCGSLQIWDQSTTCHCKVVHVSFLFLSCGCVGRHGSCTLAVISSTCSSCSSCSGCGRLAVVVV